ncbi:unnamed protein product, partial [Ceratitis capitata]
RYFKSTERNTFGSAMLYCKYLPTKYPNICFLRAAGTWMEQHPNGNTVTQHQWQAEDI